jgi:hypothetical protein
MQPDARGNIVRIWIGEQSPRRLGDRALAITHLNHPAASFLQPTRMTPPMKNRQYPDLLFMHDVIDTVELEPMHRCPPHVCKANAME